MWIFLHLLIWIHVNSRLKNDFCSANVLWTFSCVTWYFSFGALWFCTCFTLENLNKPAASCILYSFPFSYSACELSWCMFYPEGSMSMYCILSIISPCPLGALQWFGYFRENRSFYCAEVLAFSQTTLKSTILRNLWARSLSHLCLNVICL